MTDAGIIDHGSLHLVYLMWLISGISVYRHFPVAVGDEKLCTEAEAWKLPMECTAISQAVSISF